MSKSVVNSCLRSRKANKINGLLVQGPHRRELEFPLKDIKKIINSPDFDRSKLDEYSAAAKELYCKTPRYKEMMEKTGNRTREEDGLMADRFMLVFKEAGSIKDKDPRLHHGISTSTGERVPRNS